MRNSIEKVEATQPAPCVGCGYCCTKALCGAALRIYNTNILPCPSLVWNGIRHVCSLMMIEGVLGERYKEELYANTGCCSSMNSWRREPLQNRTNHEVKEEIPVIKNLVSHQLQLFLSCLGREFVSSDTIYLTLEAFSRYLLEEGKPEEEVKGIVRGCWEAYKSKRPDFVKALVG